ncbi:hypothetical protein CYY_008500 [Polysphondylium violaceum]|uniref:Short-chain dehydrogenase/reductase family protein n=1 Tax=Polysphondylium violaceum TaxID=133409 RepID=A0A8J4PMW5_9MYCE|nr:hypothetical protein CYY_008500 [Polysphondylium violaceum]
MATSLSSSKVIVITGSSSGIGQELALIYSRRPNVNLVLASRNTEKLNALATKILELNPNCKCLVVSYDASKEQDCKFLIETVIKEFGRLDLLLLCAGVSYHNQFKDTKDLNVYREMMDINYFGYMYTTFYALPFMIKQHEKENGVKPQIGVISSVSGELGLPLRAGYCASKFAVNGFFQALRLEVDKHIDITLILPTSVNTPMRENSLGKDEIKNVHFNEDESKRMSINVCCEIITKSIDCRKKKVVFPFSNYLATVLQPVFPTFIENILKKKAGGNATNNHPKAKL